MNNTEKPQEPLTILCQYKILYDGWEMDNEGWIVSDSKGDIWLKETSHCSDFFLRGDKAVASLTETIQTHERAIQSQQEALAILVSK